MPRPCLSTPIRQNMYVRTPGREQRAPMTPGPEQAHTPRGLPPVEEELAVVMPQESYNPPSSVIVLGSEAPGCNVEYTEGGDPKNDVEVPAAGMSSVNGDDGTRCLDRDAALGCIEEHLASVLDELNQHHHLMVESFHRHRQAISNIVWASFNGHPADVSANAVSCTTLAGGVNPNNPSAPSWQPTGPVGTIPSGRKSPKTSDTSAAEVTAGGSIITKHREIDVANMERESRISSTTNDESKSSQAADSSVRHSAKPILCVRQSLDDLDIIRPSMVDVTSNHTVDAEQMSPRKSTRLAMVFGGGNDSATPMLDLAIGLLILLNALMLCLYSQWEGYKAAIKLGRQQADDGWLHAKTIFAIFEHFFCIAFMAEFCLRIRWLGWEYWKDVWNDFDAFLVFTSIMDLYILQPFASSSGTNLTLLRLARVFKLVKVLRVVRVLKMFSSLRVLTKTMAASFTSLATSMVLLGIIMCLGGIFMTQTLIENINDENLPNDLRTWAFNYYGTSVRGMYTMFEVTMSGCWPNYARRTIDDISPYYGIFWVVYVSFVVFAVIRIITAIFLKHTLDNAGSDADLMIAAQMKKKRAYVEKLGEAFQAIDESGDGTITRKEFHEIIIHPKVKAYLAVLDLEVHETTSLFDLLENNKDGVITYQEFLDGVLRLKGQARTLDIVEIQCNMKRVLSCVHIICDALGVRGRSRIG